MSAGGWLLMALALPVALIVWAALPAPGTNRERERAAAEVSAHRASVELRAALAKLAIRTTAAQARQDLARELDALDEAEP
jgi:hypothetical protein